MIYYILSITNFLLILLIINKRHLYKKIYYRQGYRDAYKDSVDTIYSSVDIFKKHKAKIIDGQFDDDFQITIKVNYK